MPVYVIMGSSLSGRWGYIRSGNISKKPLHFFAKIIVCLANSFC